MACQGPGMDQCVSFGRRVYLRCLCGGQASGLRAKTWAGCRPTAPPLSLLRFHSGKSMLHHKCNLGGTHSLQGNSWPKTRLLQPLFRLAAWDVNGCPFIIGFNGRRQARGNPMQTRPKDSSYRWSVTIELRICRQSVLRGAAQPSGQQQQQQQPQQ